MFGRNKQATGDNTPPNEIGPEVDFKAKGGANKQENEANAIQARQSPGIIPTKMLIAQAVQDAAAAVQCMLEESIDIAMNRYNVIGN